MTDTPRFSVVIATYRRPKLLANCLRSLARMKAPDDGFEVVVVDDHGGLQEDIASVAVDLAVRFIRLPRNLGQSAAQHEGVRASRGEVLVLLDDDAEVDSEWLRAVARHYDTRPGVPAALGRIEAIDSTHILARTRQKVYDRRARKFTDPVFIADLKRKHGFEVADGLPLSDHISGGNSSILRETYDRIGGAASELRRKGDQLLQDRLLNGGHAIGYNPEMIIYHHHGDSYRTLMANSIKEGRGREGARILAGGRRTAGHALRLGLRLMQTPFAIRAFPEMLQADRNRLKVYCIFTGIAVISVLGEVYQFAAVRPSRFLTRHRQVMD